MTKFNKMFLRLLFGSVVIAGVCSTPVFAQVDSSDPPRIGFVDANRIIREAPQAEAATKRLEEEFSGRREQLDAEVKELADLRIKLTDSAYMEGLSKSQQDDLLDSERTLVRKIERDRTELSEDIDKERNKELENLRQTVGRLIIKIAEAEKFDLLIQGPSIIWYSNRIDLTDKILEELRKMLEQ